MIGIEQAQVPKVDERCGKNFKYRDFFECSNTYKNTGIENIPRELATYKSYQVLANLIIDPVIKKFGSLTLTYGFCGNNLSKFVHGPHSPRLDQHAGHEKNSRGLPICKRLGAAIDFKVGDFGSLAVAQWIVSNCDFDRLYIYGETRPLHVSIGPEKTRSVILMRKGKLNKKNLFPQRISVNKFLKLKSFCS